MKLSIHIRTNGAARRPRMVAGEPPPASPQATSQRHPAMRGLQVSPVHGHHCICARCDPAARRPDAA